MRRITNPRDLLIDRIVGHRVPMAEGRDSYRAFVRRNRLTLAREERDRDAGSSRIGLTGYWDRGFSLLGVY